MDPPSGVRNRLGAGGSALTWPRTPILPFKLNQDRRHRIPKQKRRITDWREHDASLRQRGSSTAWFTDEAIGRFKPVIGGGLRSRTDERRTTEVGVAVHALNRMLDLGRPIPVRIA